MSAVFGHGRLRLYLLKLLDESPRHGYEIIRLLQDRFLGVYAPSAGTVYPRLARLEEEGLVAHDQEKGGRKVYRLTTAGREELHRRVDELADLEGEIADSVHDLAREVKEDVRDSMRSLREELKHAARDVRHNIRETRESFDDAASGDVWDPAPPARDKAWRDARRGRRKTRETRREAHHAAGATERHELRRITRRFNEDVHDVLDGTVPDDDLLRDLRVVLDEALRTLDEIVGERRQRDDQPTEPRRP